MHSRSSSNAAASQFWQKRVSGPQNFEKGLEVLNVPTIIFYRNGNEINRFVELPVNSLESDIAKIIKGESYTHSYE